LTPFFLSADSPRRKFYSLHTHIFDVMSDQGDGGCKVFSWGHQMI